MKYVFYNTYYKEFVANGPKFRTTWTKEIEKAEIFEHLDLNQIKLDIEHGVRVSYIIPILYSDAIIIDVMES